MSRPSGGALDPAGPAAREIAGLMWLMVVLGVVAFVVFAVVLAVGLIRGRSSDEGADTARPNRMILLGGVAFPTIVLVVVMAVTVQTMRRIPDAAQGAIRVEVIGHQWWYEVRYPDAGVTTANEMHLPVGREVEFELSSADVIHSFWIPELGGKLDMLPEDRNRLLLRADAPGVYHSQCAEFCGLQHAKMALVAVVEPVEEFEQWLAEQARPATPAAAPRGEAVFQSSGCAGCHTVAGTEFTTGEGPDLTHLASRRTIAAGALANTRENLARWLTDPQSVKRGAKMPGTDLDGEDLEALLRYLESLR